MVRKSFFEEEKKINIFAKCWMKDKVGKMIEKEGIDEWFDNYGLMNAML